MLSMGFPINIVGATGEKTVYNENDFITHARILMASSGSDGILLEHVLSFKTSKQWSSTGDIICPSILNK